MNDRDRAVLLSVLELDGEQEVRRRYEAGQFRGKKWEGELPVIQQWLAAWCWRRVAWLN